MWHREPLRSTPRPMGMWRNWLAMLVLGALALGCAGPGKAQPQTSDEGTTEPAGTIVVTTTYGPGESGAVYIEGASAEVILVDEAGHVVATRVGVPGKTFTFAHLAPGRYQVQPALRPGSGGGGGLDPRTEECSQPVRLRRTATVAVQFRVGDPCSVTLLPDGGAASDRESPGTQTVTLSTGHCTVEPLRFDGRRWALPWHQQFGWGGGEPKGWAGTGTVERDSMNQVLYTDRGGAELMLIPSDSPAAQAPQHWGCR